MKKSPVGAALALGVLVSTAPLALAQTCESHLPESTSFPLAVTSRGLIEQTITDRNGVATTTVEPISGKALFNSPQNRVASVGPSLLVLFRACEGKFLPAIASRIEQNGAFQVRTTIQASDDILNIDEFGDSTTTNADGSCAPQCVRDVAHYVKTWRYDLRTGFYRLTEAAVRDVVSRDEAGGSQVERRTSETAFDAGRWVVEDRAASADPRPQTSPALSRDPWPLPFLREGCVELSAVHPGPDDSHIGECRVNEWGTLDPVDGRLYYYALYCLVPSSNTQPCSTHNYGAEAVAIFVRDSALDEARLVLERSSKPIGREVYHKPEMTIGAAGTYLTVWATSPDGVGSMNEYLRWEPGSKQWRHISFSPERLLEELAQRLPSNLRAGPIVGLNTDEMLLVIYLSHPDDTPADAKGFARMYLTVADDEFVVRSITIDPPPKAEVKFALDDPARIVNVAWSPAATCLGVATETTIHVFDILGHSLWTWNFRQTNRLIRADTLIVSPDCDAVAVGGGTDYKYVWRADRGGRRAYVKTVGTPSSLNFDLRGDFLAIGTGASYGYVLSPELAVRWSGPLRDLPVKWPAEIELPAPTESVEFGRAAVWSLLGAGWFAPGVGDDASDDGQWRVEWSAPYRGGSGTGLIQLWGPAADGLKARYRSDGHPRWSVNMGCPSGWITRDGRFVIATGDLEHSDYPQEEIRCGGSEQLPTYIFDRDGHIVSTWPGNGNRDERAAALLALTGERLPAPDPEPWRVSLGPAPQTYDRNADLPRQWRSPDGQTVLVNSAHSVRLYRVPRK
jgi:hypothetical protein